MEIRISRKDIFWSYLAQFFNVGSGLITLPLILRLLPVEEIGLNYLMLSINSFVAMIDFGFAPQFGRNISYVFSGARVLEKEGISRNVNGEVDYHLLKVLISVAKKVYSYMSIVVLLVLLSFGTWYIYTVTDGFVKVKYSFYIWIVFSVSTFFNIYFYYYTSLLIGQGKIKEEKKAMMASRVVYILLIFVLLFNGVGLMGVCIANLVAPFVCRYMAHKYFYTSQIRSMLSLEKYSKTETSNLFRIIWYNAKKIGIGNIGTFAALQFSMLISGIYLSFTEISSYGLMLQIVTILSGISTTFSGAMTPQLSSYRVKNDKSSLIQNFAMCMIVFYVLFIVMSLLLVFLGPAILLLLESNAKLPPLLILILYLIVIFLENNHSQFVNFILTNNSVPYVKVALLSGGLICIGDYFVLRYTNLGILGLVLVQGLVQLLYNNWYWPRYVCKELNVSIADFLLQGVQQSFKHLKLIMS